MICSILRGNYSLYSNTGSKFVLSRQRDNYSLYSNTGMSKFVLSRQREFVGLISIFMYEFLFILIIFFIIF